MLAEIYLLKLEAAVRVAKEAATTASSAPFGLLVRCRMTLRAIAGPGNHRHKDAGECWDHE
jgi:hypothetical protein